jgi:arabinofuranan 3-O-arabinosyltransferase
MTEADPRFRERLRVLLCCLGLVLLATGTRPGRIIPDTKLDMPLNPIGFLGRALHLWDIEQFGQLQNQATGYLFPMGPFYVLGHLVGMPAWIVQRLWLATLLCVAFLGARRLAERLGIGTPAARLAGGLAYALGPHALASLGINSSEYLPMALLPWIVVPLVTAAEKGRIKAAARSGLAVACCGGINGTATLAVLVVPAIFLITRRSVRLMAWWAAAVAIATAWWSVPLILLGKYAYSWLTYTEKAGTTTSTTGLLNVFRGTERWVDVLFVDGLPWWPLGHAFAAETLPVLATGVVAALGLAGLVRRGLPERTFLLVTVLAGVAIMVAGHAGPAAAETRHLIDGPLAPFRNLYKFDGLVRLPLALGLAHLLTPLRRRSDNPWRAGLRPRSVNRVSAALALAALAGVAGSALNTGLSAAGDFTAVPQYWHQASTWLNQRAGDQGILTVPGSRFGEYTWGRPMDEITQPMLDGRWAERQLVPAGSTGLTRLMDAIDQRLTSGRGSTGLSQVLARIGVRYILVRNDLQRTDLRGAWPARIHEALGSSPGIRRAAWFGDAPAGTNWPDDAVSTIDQPYAPVEIYEVAGADPVVSMAEADQALRLYGSPDALLDLADGGLLNGRPVLFGGDDPPGGGRPFVADSLRRVDRDFGELRGQTSPTLTAAEGPARDVEESGWDQFETVASYTGIKNITASASASDAGTILRPNQPGDLPYAAMDGNPFTQWESGGWSGPVDQWLRVDFDHALTPQGVTAMFTQDPTMGPPPNLVSVETQAGRVDDPVVPGSNAQRLRVPAGPTTWLRIRVRSLAWKPLAPLAARVGIAELHVDGVSATRHYRLPTAPGNATIVMSRTPDQAGCMRGSIRWVCSLSLQRQGEEGYGFDRVFTAPSPEKAQLTGTATLLDPALITKYADAGSAVRIAASSVATREPPGMPRSAFDHDTATTWVPAVGDPDPWLTLTWKRRIRVGQVTIWRPLGVSTPLKVRVEGDRGRWREGIIGPDGRLSFAPMLTKHLTIRFTGEAPQVTDVVVPGVTPFRSSPGTRVPLPCGSGPRLRLNDVVVKTRAQGTAGDLLSGRPIPFTACRTVPVQTGDNDLAPVPFDPFRVESAVVNPAGPVASAAPRDPVTVTRWTTSDRRVQVNTARDSYLVVNENFNAGWQAEIGGRTLRPVRLDGWRQAWAVPAGTVGTVHLSYRPDGLYRTAVYGGLGLLPLLLIPALWPVRRRAVPEPRPPGRATIMRRVAGAAAGVLLAAGLGYWVGGVAATIVAGAAALVLTPRQARPFIPWLVTLATLVATVLAIIGLGVPLGQNDRGQFYAETLPQLFCLVVLAGLTVALFGPATSAARGEGDGRGDARGSDRRVETGQGADEDGGAEGSAEHPQGNGGRPAPPGGVPEGDGAAGQDPGRPAEDGQQERLGEELGTDLPARRPLGPAQADLPPPLQNGNDHGVGDADTTDEQADGAEAEEQAGEGPGGGGTGGEGVRRA